MDPTDEKQDLWFVPLLGEIMIHFGYGYAAAVFPVSSLIYVGFLYKNIHFIKSYKGNFIIFFLGYALGRYVQAT